MAEMKAEFPLTREQWDEISERLRAPFDPAEVNFRVQGKINEQTGRAQVVAFIDARVVQDRLDTVVGAGNWSFDWTPLVIDKGEVMVAKGSLTIFDVSKSDAGSASNFEQSLGAVSHCFKRAAVHWGVGRYLYNLPVSWVAVEKGGRIPEQVLRELRSKLPRPVHAAAIDKPKAVQLDVGADVGAATSTGLTVKPTPLANRQAATPRPTHNDATGATEKQLVSIRKLCEALGRPVPEGRIAYLQARELLTELSAEYQRSRRAS